MPRRAHPTACPSLTISLAAEVRDNIPGVLLCMVDDGPGFDSDVLERIFEPYVTTKQRGTGLGLAIVRRIIDEHSGQIEGCQS